jgi:YD repeat-containing protein
MFPGSHPQEPGGDQQIRRMNFRSRVMDRRCLITTSTILHRYQSVKLVTGDLLERVTSFVYEPVFNQVTQVTDTANKVTTFNYDANGNLIGDPDGMGIIDPLLSPLRNFGGMRAI